MAALADFRSLVTSAFRLNESQDNLFSRELALGPFERPTRSFNQHRNNRGFGIAKAFVKFKNIFSHTKVGDCREDGSESCEERNIEKFSIMQPALGWSLGVHQPEDLYAPYVPLATRYDFVVRQGFETESTSDLTLTLPRSPSESHCTPDTPTVYSHETATDTACEVGDPFAKGSVQIVRCHTPTPRASIRSTKARNHNGTTRSLPCTPPTNDSPTTLSRARRPVSFQQCPLESQLENVPSFGRRARHRRKPSPFPLLTPEGSGILIEIEKEHGECETDGEGDTSFYTANSSLSLV